MKIILFSIFVGVFIISGCSNKKEPMVKKSNMGICHEKGTNYYEKTKNFTSFNSLSDCLKSGGREPKK